MSFACRASSGLPGAGGARTGFSAFFGASLAARPWRPLAAAADRQQHLALACGGLLRLLALGLLGRRGRGLLLAGEAALQRVHQIDDVAAGFRRRLRRDLDAVALLVDQLDQRAFVAVLELLRLEVEPDFCSTICFARSSMSLVIFTSWMSSKYSFSLRTS